MTETNNVCAMCQSHFMIVKSLSVRAFEIVW